MIMFDKSSDNKQFISIMLYGGEDTAQVYDSLTHVFDNLSLYAKDHDEIVLNIPDCGYGFSLNQLRRAVEPIANAKIYLFTTDLNSRSQRYVG